MSLNASVTNKPTSDVKSLYRPASFSNDIPTPGLFAWYAIFTVKGVLDKNTTLEEYSKQAKEMGFEFYTNKVLKQRVTEVEINDVEKSEKPTFEKFAKSVGLSDEVFDICNEVIRLKSEE